MASEMDTGDGGGRQIQGVMDHQVDMEERMQGKDEENSLAGWKQGRHMETNSGNICRGWIRETVPRLHSKLMTCSLQAPGRFPSAQTQDKRMLTRTPHHPARSRPSSPSHSCSLSATPLSWDVSIRKEGLEYKRNSLPGPPPKDSSGPSHSHRRL